MATLVVPSKVQKLEYDVTTAEGAARVTVVTGMLQVTAAIGSSGPQATQSVSIRALVDPLLTPGQFRKATAIASTAAIQHVVQTAVGSAQWSVDDVQATFDDESGRVQLTFDASVTVSGTNNGAWMTSFSFQVTTLAKVGQ